VLLLRLLSLLLLLLQTLVIYVLVVLKAMYSVVFVFDEQRVTAIGVTKAG
jgi:hypothetical protein